MRIFFANKKKLKDIFLSEFLENRFDIEYFRGFNCIPYVQELERCFLLGLFSDTKEVIGNVFRDADYFFLWKKTLRIVFDVLSAGNYSIVFIVKAFLLNRRKNRNNTPSSLDGTPLPGMATPKQPFGKSYQPSFISFLSPISWKRRFGKSSVKANKCSSFESFLNHFSGPRKSVSALC